MRDVNFNEPDQDGLLSALRACRRYRQEPHVLRDRTPSGPRLLTLSSAFIMSIAIIALAPCVAGAQAPQKIYRVAHLSAAGRTPDGAPPRPLREGLRQLGYVEGQNVVYEARFADGKVDRLPGLAAELVALKVDVIVAQGRPSVVAAKQATSTIPIVIAPASSDAVATGLIASLARPGGNVTGLTDELDQLSAKRMELLKETVPKAARIAVLWNANDPGMNLCNSGHCLATEVSMSYRRASWSRREFVGGLTLAGTARLLGVHAGPAVAADRRDAQDRQPAT